MIWYLELVSHKTGLFSLCSPPKNCPILFIVKTNDHHDAKHVYICVCLDLQIINMHLGILLDYCVF